MRTDQPVRSIGPAELGVELSAGGAQPGTAKPKEPATNPEELKDDPVYLEVLDCMDDGFAGVILSGPPGTSKSWYASKIANLIAEDPARVRFIQFHASFQYEDFMQGWVSDGKGSFELKKKHFLQLCENAEKTPNAQHVLVIDEISRSDAARVFGEALTYLETTKRNVDFYLASGDKVRVPSNVFIIATMNPWDISVAELDYALERRFAYVEMRPQFSILAAKLKENGADEVLVDKVSRLFAMLQGRANPMIHLGHAYLMRVHDLDSLQRVWRTQIRPHVAKVTRLEPTELQSIEAAWSTIALAEPEPAAKPVEQPAPIAATPPPPPAEPAA